MTTPYPAARETWRHCRASEPHEAATIEGTQYTQPGTGATEAACANCGDGEAVVLQADSFADYHRSLDCEGEQSDCDPRVVLFS
jgi:hypothetical protein